METWKHHLSSNFIKKITKKNKNLNVHCLCKRAMLKVHLKQNIKKFLSRIISIDSINVYYLFFKHCSFVSKYKTSAGLPMIY